MAGRLVEVPDDYATRYEISEAERFSWREYEANPDAMYQPVKRKQGHYERSNVVHKNGTVVFEWMGWRNGGKAI